ncbi:MAG: bifunctional DNA primase/polymerase [Candidatus Paceibacterota bacterium]|jgi:replicative DNA helicase
MSSLTNNKEENSLLQQALLYAEKGISIIPVGRDKKPLLAWKEFTERKATQEEIKEWWSFYDNPQIGIVTGRVSGITVVDIEAGGDTTGMPITLIAKTGGGGWHYYFKYTPDIGNKARIRPLTDIRNDNGFVVAPNSSNLKGNYEWIVEEPLNDFPHHLFGIEKKQDWQQITEGAEQGSRNESAAKMTGKLLKTFRREEWNTAAWPMVVAWNQNNKPPLDEKELRATFESICRKAAQSGDGLMPEEREKPDPQIEYVSFTDLIGRATDELLSVDPAQVISFGYDWLDKRLTGIFPGELVIVGSESGGGKTTLCNNIIYKTSALGHKCLIFGLEDRLNDYGIKALYYELNKHKRLYEGITAPNYDWNLYRTNRLHTDPVFMNYMGMAYDSLKKDNVYFVKVDEIMTIELLEKIIEEKTQEGFQLFLIDHLHYFDLQKGQNSKADYIEEVMIKIRTLQRRTGARIIMVVHYRKLNGLRPTLDSFKDSISIIQNANYVINLWRDRSENAEGDSRFKTYFYIPKARNPNGEGVCEVVFNPNTNDYEMENKWGYGT